jgi:hypothetical protein
MVTFVLSFGRGDVFERLGQFMGTRRREPEVAKMYGKDVTRTDIFQLRDQRVLANQFMDFAVRTVNQGILRTVSEAMKNWDEATRRQVEQGFFYAQFGMMQRDPRTLAGAYQQLQSALATLAHTQKKDEAKQVQDLLYAVSREYQLAQRPRRELFFGGTTRTEDLLNFMLWEHQADRLGIQLTNADIGRLVGRETRNLFSATEFKQYQDNYLGRRSGGANWESVFSALGSEFRVRLAQEALLGYNPMSYGIEHWPAPITPYSYWQFYEEQCTQVNVDLLAIPVNLQEFRKKVGEPTTDQLKEFYEKHKDREPDPASKEAGFKQPARIQVEWVRPDREHFLKEAEKAQVREVVQLFAGAGAPTVAPVLPLAYQARFLSAYEGMRYEFSLPPWSSPDFALYFNPAVNRPEGVARLVGDALGQAGTRGSLLASVASQGATVVSEAKGAGPQIAEEARKRGQVGAALVLAGAGGSPFAVPLFTLAGLEHYAHEQQQYLPPQAVAQRVLTKERDGLARTLAGNSLEELEHDLRLLAGVRTAEEMRQFRHVNRPEQVTAAVGQVLGAAATVSPAVAGAAALSPAEVARDRREQLRLVAEAVLAGSGPLPTRAVGLAAKEQTWHLVVLKDYLEKAIRRLGLREGSSDEFRDRFDIARDEGLKPLREAYLSQPGFAGEDPKKRYPSLFFGSPTQMQPGLTERYLPERLSAGNETFLYWKTEDKPAYVPPFEEVKDKVKDRWVFEKAREFAEKEAKRIEAEARKSQGGAEQNLRDARAKLGAGEIFELRGVTRLIPPPEQVAVMSQFPGQYVPYKVPENVIEHPTAKFVDELLGLQKKGDVKVLTNQPEDTYYVAALVSDRVEPSKASFYQAYQSQPQPLLERLRQDNLFRQEYVQAFIEGLKKEAGFRLNQETVGKMDEKQRGDLEGG